MRINADFSKRVTVRPGDVDWVASPMAGVERRMLDRIGDEVARATSLVRYAPGSYFAEHTHGGGEEFFVLEGVFSDEHGDYPAGTYVRNPIGTHHKPHSDPGCTIFVKLHQFERDDTTQKSINTDAAAFRPSGDAGISVLDLHQHSDERCTVEQWQATAEPAQRTYPGGAEILVLDGELEDEDGVYPAGSWLRMPPGSQHTLCSPTGARAFIKTGHLGVMIRA